jgi:hypothetical protein
MPLTPNWLRQLGGQLYLMGGLLVVRGPHQPNCGQGGRTGGCLLYIDGETIVKYIEVPVIGVDEHSDHSTSGDIHLYVDPKTNDGSNPLFYAGKA